MGMQGLHYRLYVRPSINRLVGEGCSNTNYRIGSGVVCKGSGATPGFNGQCPDWIHFFIGHAVSNPPLKRFLLRQKQGSGKGCKARVTDLVD